LPPHDPRFLRCASFLLDGHAGRLRDHPRWRPRAGFFPGETLWQVAKRAGERIPHLCFKDAPGYRADGNCRACMVEIEGERTLAASLHPQAGHARAWW
jgi:hypothetical protein